MFLMVCNKSEEQELLVEMSYDGDETLGCYMLENALSILNQKNKRQFRTYNRRIRR